MAAGLLTAFVFATVVTVSFFLTEAAIAPGRVDCISENGKTINFEGVLKMKAGNRTRSLRYGQPPGRLAKTAFGHALSNERKFLSTEPRLVVRRLITGEPQRRPFFGATSSARSAVYKALTVDLGEKDVMAQMATSHAVHLNKKGFSLDPAQETCVLLDSDTPAIILTAGAGTGKTHTLAARLARLLGVKIERPDARVDRRALIAMPKLAPLNSTTRPAESLKRGHAKGRWGGEEESLDHAMPESIMVLSFTRQGAQVVVERAMAAGLPKALADRVCASTFQSFAAAVLRQHQHLIWPQRHDRLSSPLVQSDWPSRFDIIGQADQLKLVAKALIDAETHPTDDEFAPVGSSFERRGPSARAGGLSGSWGMPATAEEKAEVAARRRRRSKNRARLVLSRLAFWKEKGLTPEDVRNGRATIGDDTDEAAATIYAAYQRDLRSRRQVDFGDLCMVVVELFTNHPEVLERYRWRIRHILVDEYQDTSPAQQRLLKALVLGTSSPTEDAPQRQRNPSMAPLNGGWTGSAPPRFSMAEESPTGQSERMGDRGNNPRGLGVTLFCAGDEDQHIYGWRGTTVDHLHSFEDDFPGAVRCALPETHRLPVHLLRSATGLMRAGGLVPLLNIRMKTRTNTGAVVRAQGLWNSRDEGKWVALEAAKLYRERGISYKDMAVISRTAYNSRELEESLAARGVPYTVEGGWSFFSRPEIETPLFLLALCANPQDDMAFREFASLRRKTHFLLDWATPGTLRTIEALAKKEGVSTAEAVRLSVSRGGLPGGDASRFIHGLRRWSGLLLGWSRLTETERGAAIWRIFWEAGFLPPHADAIFASLGDTTRGDGIDKITKGEQAVAHLAIAVSRCDNVGRFLLRSAKAREDTSQRRENGRSSAGGRGGRWEGATGKTEEGPTLSQNALKPESSRVVVEADRYLSYALLSKCLDDVSPQCHLEMMTMHQAKGKEFKVVFLTGWDEGSFPLLPNSGNAERMDSLAHVQEERRLGYVALTRASQNVIISFSKKRRFKETWVTSSGPSRYNTMYFHLYALFLLEMPQEHVTVLPDAIGRVLHDYPGMSGSHTLVFDGLTRGGKLRRSRAVLPSPTSNSEVLMSALEERNTDHDLPPGCMIVNRSADLVNAQVRSTSNSKTRSMAEEAPSAAKLRQITTPGGRSAVGKSLPDDGALKSARESAGSVHERARPSMPTRDPDGGESRDAPNQCRTGSLTPPSASYRGRKRKILLDASGVSAERPMCAEEVLNLVLDPAFQQASLKKYFRAILAIQHGCARGSIPVWKRRGVHTTDNPQEAIDNSLDSATKLGEAGAPTRAALSACSTLELATYIIFLGAVKGSNTNRNKEAA